MPNPFTCDVSHAFDPIRKTWTAKATLKLDASDEARASLREIPEKAWKTFCFVALRMDSQGTCRVTADVLARDMGIGKAQATKRLLELAETDIEGKKLLSVEGEVFSLTPLSGNPTLLGMIGADEPAAETPKPEEAVPDEPPTTQDLIRELTRKMHKIPGVQVLRGNYSLIARALNGYGYEAVSEALEDLAYEYDMRDQLGHPMPTNGEIGRLLMQRAAWNVKRLESQGRPETKGNLWDYYAWNEAGDQLVPKVEDPPFIAVAVGGKILINLKQKEVCL